MIEQTDKQTEEHKDKQTDGLGCLVLVLTTFLLLFCLKKL